MEQEKPNPDPANTLSNPANVIDEPTPEPEFLKKIKAKGSKYLNYQTLWKWDIGVAVIHIIVMLALSFQYLMLLPFLIRVFRSFLYFMAMKNQDDKGKYDYWIASEFKFRKYSCYGYLLIGIFFQFLTSVTNYCKSVDDIAACRKSYFMAMLILLILHQIVDTIFFLIVKSNYDQQSESTGNAIEMQRNSYGKDVAAHSMA